MKASADRGRAHPQRAGAMRQMARNTCGFFSNEPTRTGRPVLLWRSGSVRPRRGNRQRRHNEPGAQPCAPTSAPGMGRRPPHPNTAAAREPSMASARTGRTAVRPYVCTGDEQAATHSEHGGMTPALQRPQAQWQRTTAAREPSMASARTGRTAVRPYVCTGDGQAATPFRTQRDDARAATTRSAVAVGVRKRHGNCQRHQHEPGAQPCAPTQAGSLT